MIAVISTQGLDILILWFYSVQIIRFVATDQFISIISIKYIYVFIIQYLEGHEILQYACDIMISRGTLQTYFINFRYVLHT